MAVSIEGSALQKREHSLAVHLPSLAIDSQTNLYDETCKTKNIRVSIQYNRSDEFSELYSNDSRFFHAEKARQEGNIC